MILVGAISVTVPAEVVVPSPAPTAGGIWFQEVAIHIAGTAAHHVAGHNILGYCCLHKASRRIHFHLAGFHVRFIDNATHTAIVVNMAMSINDGDNRLIATVLKYKSIPALAVSAETSGSTTVIPSLPSIIVILDKSRFRIW